MKCINPATEETIERVSCDDRRSIHNKFRRLKEDHRSWRRCSFEVRSQHMARFANALERRAPEVAQLLVREVGTPIERARDEVRYVCRRIEDFIAGAEEAVAGKIGPGDVGAGARVRRVPLGVVGHLSTWKRPLATAVEVMVPALLAGNRVLYKPSEHATLVGRGLVRAMRESEVGADVVGMAVGDGAIGDFILDEPLSGVAFSGSASTGRMVAEKLARRMIPRHIDVGVIEGVYVCEDVDLEVAARRVADRAFCSGGRGCRGLDRVYVHDAVARPFTQALCRRVSSLDVGDPARGSTSVGPVVCARRIGTLEYQIGDAVQKGARLLLGGRARGGRGFFFDPTVLVDVDHRMLVMREDTPGPVICIQRVCDDAEAAHRLGDVDFGFRAGMICRDLARAAEVFQSLNADGVYWWRGVGEEDEAQRDSSQIDVAMEVVGSPRDAVRRFTRPQSWALGRDAT